MPLGSGRQKPGMRPSVLQCTGQPPTEKDHLAPVISTATVETSHSKGPEFLQFLQLSSHQTKFLLKTKSISGL